MSFDLPHYDFFVNKDGVVYYDGGAVANDGNSLYQVYLEWIKKGNIAKEIEENNEYKIN
jgi:hypothetical protein